MPVMLGMAAIFGGMPAITPMGTRTMMMRTVSASALFMSFSLVGTFAFAAHDTIVSDEERRLHGASTIIFPTNIQRLVDFLLERLLLPVSK